MSARNRQPPSICQEHHMRLVFETIVLIIGSCVVLTELERDTVSRASFIRCFVAFRVKKPPSDSKAP